MKVFASSLVFMTAVSERLMIRPDARALVVLADGHTHTLGDLVVHIAYRF